MKVLQIIRLRNSDHASIQKGLETFGKHGSGSITAFWFSADARTVFGVYEIDDPSELQKYMTLYAPYIESLEQHVVVEGEAGFANMQAGLDLAT
jgi:hypothetical protein